MARKKDPKQLEKLMAYILGRRPDEFGLVPDEDGFVRMKDLLKAISEEPGWGYARKSHINEVLVTLRDNLFVVEDDRIKSACPDEAVSPVAGTAPPKILYHCVRRKAYPVVLQRGIIPMGTPRVFLATTEELALRIGKRRDPTPVLLTVQAQRAFEEGVKFLRQGELIHIVDHVPIDYFSGPPLAKEKKESGKPKKEPSLTPEAVPAGGFFFDIERSQALQQQRVKRKGLKKEIGWKKEARRLRRKRK
ncbi:MAG: RNA 2'-phosphotransferase [Desulfobacterales bacterium]|nr:RNA 2'-phosphotransferase [Desulfobacterales bacterium]